MQCSEYIARNLVDVKLEDESPQSFCSAERRESSLALHSSDDSSQSGHSGHSHRNPQDGVRLRHLGSAQVEGLARKRSHFDFDQFAATTRPRPPPVAIVPVFRRRLGGGRTWQAHFLHLAQRVGVGKLASSTLSLRNGFELLTWHPDSGHKALCPLSGRERNY